MEIKERNFMSPSHQPYFVLPPPPPPPPPPPLSSRPLSFSSGFRSNGFNLNSKVSPSILLIIIILAIIFFVSGLLHLLVRFLLRPSTRDPDEMDNVTAFQGQLQQLFHLHDAGVDQSFIDTLPVFNYKAIIGVKTPFDCAVCLSEFESEDKLRLLPKCSHAFHMECIDTWLLSHSTCPLCRASLLPDFSSSSNPNPNCSPIVLVLESGGESSRELVSEREIGRVNSHLSAHFEDEFRHQQQPLALADLFRKSCEIQEKEEEKIVQVKLGKFKNVDGEGSSSNSTATTENNVDERRCFSMGSFAYVMDDNTSLKVPIRTATRTPMKKQSNKKPALPLIPGHRPAMSECGGCDSRREFLINSGFSEGFKKNNLEIQGCSSSSSSNSISRSREQEQEQEQSFSVSKIWLRGKKDKTNNNSLARIGTESSRRAFSVRFPPLQQDDHNRRRDQEDELKGNKNGRRTVSEIDIGRWENGGSEFGIDLEDSQSCNSLDSQANPHSFARRTLLWLIGRQNKVVHSTFSSNV